MFLKLNLLKFEIALSIHALKEDKLCQQYRW